jgi:hypothetical protein
LLHNAIGSAYIENILRQNAQPTTNHPPIHLDNERLNRIHLEEPLLADYDTYILSKKRQG